MVDSRCPLTAAALQGDDPGAAGLARLREAARREGLDRDALAALELVYRAPRRQETRRVIASILDAELDEPLRLTLLRVAAQRDLLAAVAGVPQLELPWSVVSPGVRVLLSTEGGRRAITALIAGDLGPLRHWLEREVVDPELFCGITVDVPLGDLEALAVLTDRLATDTGQLPRAVQDPIADAWVHELVVDQLDDAVAYPDVVRVVGERLLSHDLPILLWHAADQLSLVADDPDLAERVLTRCLPAQASCDGRLPARAAVPFLRVLSCERAAAILEGCEGRLEPPAWEAVAEVFLAEALRRDGEHWRTRLDAWAGSASELGEAARTARDAAA